MALKNLYIFDGNANDSVGSNNGTLQGSPAPILSTGYFDVSSGYGAYKYTGDNGSSGGNYSNILLTRSDFEYTAITPFSFAVWLKNVAGRTNTQVVFYNGSRSTAYTWIRVFSNGRYSLEANNGGGNYINVITQEGTLIDDKWQLFVGTFDGTDMKGYIDGLLVETNSNSGGTLSGNFFDSNSKATIGAAWDNANSNYDYGFDGYIGQFSNYDHVLTPTDIRNLYKQGKNNITMN